MTLIERIPLLDDRELLTLLANARRLDVVGTPAQRTAAAEVLPVLELEASKRRQVNLEAATRKRGALAAAKRKAAAAAAAAKAA
ncbi:MAG: hypothetical protein J7515_02575 [Caulobacter sp.]|nr:hypothetical protein [Caulobacter sp.]